MSDGLVSEKHPGIGQDVSFGSAKLDDVMKALNGVPTSEYSDRDIDNFVKLSDIRMKTHKMTELINAWNDHQENERGLRKKIAYWVFGLLTGELMLGNTFFALFGFKIFSFPEWLATSFFIGMYVQVISVVMVVVNGVFPKPKEDFLGKLTDVIKDL